MFLSLSCCLSWDHLRVCGADRPPVQPSRRVRGSSPRVRSRHRHMIADTAGDGIISACAEQTVQATEPLRLDWDHLRVCGADDDAGTRVFQALGSSPRVRSRPRGLGAHRVGDGIISACAEQTMCGYWRLVRLRGSSPRVRSRPVRQTDETLTNRIISACAEQTSMRRPSIRAMRDHLRVCGADVELPLLSEVYGGSSPRVRSRQCVTVRTPLLGGIISACAEQTTERGGRSCLPGDHLRVCGADIGVNADIDDGYGSSPRVRSRPPGRYRAVVRFGSISACAEQTCLRSS